MTPADIAPKRAGLDANARIESGLAAQLARLMQAPRSKVQAALPQLQQAFGSQNRSLQILATVLAGRAGPAGLSILSSAQSAKSTAVRQFAAMGLGQIGPGAGAVEGLARAMQDGDEVTAKVAAAALGRSRDAVTPLRSLAQSSNPRVAALAVRSLGQATEGTGRLVPELAAARHSTNPHVALAAAESALRVDESSADALDDLIERLRADPDPEVRSEAAAACGRLMEKAEGSADALRRALASDPEAKVRANAAIALVLAAGRDRASVSSLARALGDRDPTVQKASIMALHSLENKAEPALPALRALDQVADEEMSQMIAAAIERIGAP